MKLRRLPVTDLARICPLPRSMKAVELRKYGSFQPRKSYRPVRKVLPWLYNLDLPLLKLEQEAWERVAAKIAAEARPDFVDSCIEVAKLIWQLNASRQTVASPFNGPPFFIGPHQSVPFGIVHICRISTKLLFPFVQMRRMHGLDFTGLGILASLVREAYVFGDYEEAGVEIIDLSIPRGMKHRQTRIYYGEELPKYSLDELNEMATEVYEVIAEIEKEDEES